ncbi:MAG: hypothetical protein KDC07_06575 [Chitinophagaceae bacterium]|nr:hypothetical protein [Chitinophagaceae bacterium]MCB9044521.1 hypothetical protein [Chitinophagales bacterium]
MKRLVVLSMLLLAYNANAQKLSLAVGVGGAVNGAPTGNLIYKGDQTILNYATTAKLTRTTITNWQYGIVGHMHELSSKSSIKYPGFPNRHLLIDSIGGDGKKLVYAKYTVSACAFLNKNFQLNKKTSIYLGVAAGWGFARNNSLYYAENESYNGPDGGDGMCLGGQLGINAYMNDYVAFFMDVSARYYNFKFDKEVEAPTVRPFETLEYSILAVPVTVGLSFDLHKVAESTRNTFNVRKQKYN